MCCATVRSRSFDSELLGQSLSQHGLLGLHEKFHFKESVLHRMQSQLVEQGLAEGMSHKGDCLNNATMESFFGTLKSEFFYLHRFESIEQFQASIRLHPLLQPRTHQNKTKRSGFGVIPSPDLGRLICDCPTSGGQFRKAPFLWLVVSTAQSSPYARLARYSENSSFTCGCCSASSTVALR